MIVTDLKSLAQVQAFNNIGGLACNANGYPYVTLLFAEKGKETKANNLYFSNSNKKDESGKEIPNTGFATEIIALFSLEAGQKSTATAITLIDFLLEQECTVAQVLNSKNEIRYKLARRGSTKYLSASTFAQKFGLEITEEAMDFDVVAFKKEFTSKNQTNDTPSTATSSSVSKEEKEIAEARLIELDNLLASGAKGREKNKIEKEIDAILAKYPQFAI